MTFYYKQRTISIIVHFYSLGPLTAHAKASNTRIAVGTLEWGPTIQNVATVVRYFTRVDQMLSWIREYQWNHQQR